MKHVSWHAALSGSAITSGAPLRLEAENLVVGFNRVVALDRAAFVFEGSGAFGIVGPNGAGKTTLFNVVSGWLLPAVGSVRYRGREICGLTPEVIARLGIARSFQEVRVFRQMTVLENLLVSLPDFEKERPFVAITRIGLRQQEDASRKQVAAVLELIGLEAQAGRLAGELSFGQQKLLTLGICLATQASLLLLDEPVAGVQPALREIILQHLRQIADLGRMVVFIEHDLDAVRQIADRVVVMDAGRTVAFGSPAEVLQREEFLRAFLG